MKSIWSRLLGTLLAAALTAPFAHAQSYPAKPVLIISPFAAGGITDIMARYYAQKLTTRLGQPVIVENRPGGGGTVATQAVIRAPGDGYTLLFGNRVTHITSPLINRVARPTDKELTAVATLADTAPIIVAGNATPYKTLHDLITKAKQNPGKLNFGSPGNGTAAHLAATLFMAQAGIEMVHVPYKGSAPALQDLVGGNLDVVFDYPASSAALIKGGRIHALATLYQTRFPSVPDTPTMSELGIKGVESGSWQAFFVPAATPKPITERLAKEILAINAEAETKQKLTEWGATSLDLAGDDLSKFIGTEVERWRVIVEKSGIKPD